MALSRRSVGLNPIQQAAPEKGRFSELFRDRRFPAVTNFTAFAAFGEDFYCPYCPLSQPIEL
jgi:hypothetical protein